METIRFISENQIPNTKHKSKTTNDKRWQKGQEEIQISQNTLGSHGLANQAI